MPGITAWPFEGKREDFNANINLKELFVTAQGLGPSKRGLDTITTGAYTVGTVTAVTGSTASILKVTGHAMKKGDFIRKISTSNAIDETEIGILEVIDVDNVRLAGVLSASISNGDTFSHCRYITMGLSSTGSLQSNQVFLKNGVPVTVTEDTVTPANNIPFPVKLCGVTGDITVTAQNLNVQLSHSGTSPDSTQIGDGTTVWGITAGTGEGKVIDSGANTKLGNIDTKLPASLGAKAMTASLSVTFASDQTGLAITAASLPLPSGAATETTLDNLYDSFEAAKSTFATQTTLSSINTNMATSSNQTAISNKLPASLGSKAASESLSVTLSTENLAYIDELETEIKKLSACVASNQVAVKLADLNGAATETTVGNINNKLPSALGPQTVANSLSVTNAAETVLAHGVHNFVSTNVTDTAFVQLLASVGSVIGRKIYIMVQGGEPMYLGIGSAGNEVSSMIIPPGGYNGPICLTIPASSRLSLKAVNASTTINTGKLFYNIVG